MTSPVPPAEKKFDTTWEALRLAMELGYIIALPAFAFGFGGAYVDKYLGTTPLFIIGGLLLALFLSGFVVYRKVKMIIR